MNSSKPLKRRIHQNVWGNINGYLGTRQVHCFGSDALSTDEWLEHGEWLVGNLAGVSLLRRIISISPDGTVGGRKIFRIIDRPYEAGALGGRYDRKDVAP